MEWGDRRGAPGAPLGWGRLGGRQATAAVLRAQGCAQRRALGTPRPPARRTPAPARPGGAPPARVARGLLAVPAQEPPPEHRGAAPQTRARAGEGAPRSPSVRGTGRRQGGALGAEPARPRAGAGRGRGRRRTATRLRAPRLRPARRCGHKADARHPPGPARSGLRGPPLLLGRGRGSRAARPLSAAPARAPPGAAPSSPPACSRGARPAGDRARRSAAQRRGARSSQRPPRAQRPLPPRPAAGRRAPPGRREVARGHRDERRLPAWWPPEDDPPVPAVSGGMSPSQDKTGEPVKRPEPGGRKSTGPRGPARVQGRLCHRTTNASSLPRIPEAQLDAWSWADIAVNAGPF